MKKWKVTAELFWSAERIETVVVKANTEHKAKIFGVEAFKKKYPNIKDMISVFDIEEIE